ncbi:MAG: hypothetical protein DRI44_08675 [Chlamydiae bacterium]|nr:MAG: hypothetical protein DRI44_08675 [Chlamydiota bacterium]
MKKTSSLIKKNVVNLLCVSFLLALLSGCATNQVTKPKPLALAERGHNDKILAIMPLGKMNPAYINYQKHKLESWFAPKMLYGKGEISGLEKPYEAFALAIYNRLRGYDVFRRVVIVNSREEADALGASYLLCFRINDCYSVGEGANWNFVYWITYKAVFDADVVVYDLDSNERITHQKIESKAYTSSPWSTSDVRAYLRRTLLRGVTFHNAISQINF